MTQSVRVDEVPKSRAVMPPQALRRKLPRGRMHQAGGSLVRVRDTAIMIPMPATIKHAIAT